MELILIACCKTKREGGDSLYSGSKLVSLLQPASYHRLLQTRAELAKMIGEPSGPDLDGERGGRTLLFLPAIQRYQGRVYKRGEIEVLYPIADNVHLLIISALYGVLDGDDPIRKYDLEMNARIPGNVRINCWWKKHGLGNLILESILNLKPTRIHDLLPKVYRDSLGRQPRIATSAAGIEWRSYEYPGEGQGSIWSRGNDLQRLLKLGDDQPVPPAEILNQKPVAPISDRPTHTLGTVTVPPPASQAGQIRDYVIEHYITPARERGEQAISIRSGDIHKAMHLYNCMPNVCNAIDSDKFQNQANVKLVQRKGPKRSSTVEWTFEI